jgi:hypothetical protein
MKGEGRGWTHSWNEKSKKKQDVTCQLEKKAHILISTGSSRYLVLQPNLVICPALYCNSSIPPCIIEIRNKLEYMNLVPRIWWSVPVQALLIGCCIGWGGRGGVRRGNLGLGAFRSNIVNWLLSYIELQIKGSWRGGGGARHWLRVDIYFGLGVFAIDPTLISC